VDASFRRALTEHGAEFSDGPLPSSFGDPAAELRAGGETCALANRSDLSRLLGTGPDLLDLLHRLSTADLSRMAGGEGKPTVLTTAKGRIVERLFVHHLGDAGVLLIGGPESASRVLLHLKRFTFAEQTGLGDETERTVQFALLGPRAAQALAAAGFRPPQRYHAAAEDSDGFTLHIVGHDGLGGEGFSVIAPSDRVVPTWSRLAAAVAGVEGRPIGSVAAEADRVLNGIAAAGHELTEEHNPLEAGLRDAISFSKGCYVGQEVVARLNTYDKVSLALKRLRLPDGSTPPQPGTPIFQGDREVGRITSALIPPGWNHPIALAYLKVKKLAEGEPLEMGGEGVGQSLEVVASFQ